MVRFGFVVNYYVFVDINVSLRNVEINGKGFVFETIFVEVINFFKY